MHAFLNPVITVDGDSATAAWLLWIASVIDQRAGAVYLGADLAYLRAAEGWRLDAVGLHDGLRIPGTPAPEAWSA